MTDSLSLSPSEYKALAEKPPKRSKYGNKHVPLDGHRFDSQSEANRYGDLLNLERAGLISDLECHPKFALIINGWCVCTYEGDFRYRGENGQVVVEDVKGVETAVFKLKAKLFKALYGFPITVRRAA